MPIFLFCLHIFYNGIKLWIIFVPAMKGKKNFLRKKLLENSPVKTFKENSEDTGSGNCFWGVAFVRFHAFSYCREVKRFFLVN